MIRIFLVTAFVAQIAFSTVLMGRASFEQSEATESTWLSLVEGDVPMDQRRDAGDFMTGSEWATLAPSLDQLTKAARLRKLIQKHVSYNTTITEQELGEILVYTDFLVNHQKLPKRLAGYSFYIHPKKPFLSMPVQIYHDGTIYLHLLNRDPGRKRGGYKTFSRSIELNSERVVAHLSIAIRHVRNLNNIMMEISTMKEFRAISQVLDFYHYDLMVSDRVPGVVSSSDFSESNDLSYHMTIETPLYEGDLGLKRKNFGTFSNLMQFSLRSAQALRSFHIGGWIHRDVKPSNFFVRENNGPLKVVIADFGLSQPIDHFDLGRNLSGTREYMAPDICRNRVEYQHSFFSFSEGTSADVFGLGMTFYGLLMGRKSELRTALQKVNVLALPPKGHKRGTMLEMKHALRTYRNQYETVFSSAAIRKYAGNNKEMKSYLQLIAGMTAPKARDRFELGRVIETLENLIDK